jgi:hypothetical protein
MSSFSRCRSLFISDEIQWICIFLNIEYPSYNCSCLGKDWEKNHLSNTSPLIEGIRNYALNHWIHHLILYKFYQGKFYGLIIVW